jgi:hypothetical protein
VTALRIYKPRPQAVEVGQDGAPVRVGRVAVEGVREEWLVEDRWWAARPLRRRYFELAAADGSVRVVFLDLESGRWFAQQGA